MKHSKFISAFAITILCICFLSACLKKNKETEIALSKTEAATQEDETTDTALNDTISMPASEESRQQEQEEDSMEQANFYITADGHTFTAAFADNSSAEALKELLAKEPLTITMHDYGNFEKVGEIRETLPRNDISITTEPGDVILYQGSSVTIYYDTNTWNFTRLGKIENVTTDDLLSVFGEGDVTVTFSLSEPK